MVTREPTVGPVGQLLRAVLEQRLARSNGLVVQFDWTTLALLFAADRMDHVTHEIVPALESGTWVVSDRYDLSSLIYQSLTAPEPARALEWVRQLNAEALRPDLVVVLDVDASVAEERRRLRGGPEELFERRELQLRLAEAYATAETYSPSDPIEHVDGNGSQSDVAAALLEAVLGRLVD